jgi:putative ABC transport system permease protein
MYTVNWKEGSPASLQRLGTTGTVLTKGFADDHKLHVGDTLSVLTPSSRRVRLKVTGIARDDAGLFANLTISLPLARAAFGQRDDGVDFVKFAPGASNEQIQPRINRLLDARFPQAKSQTAAQFKKDQAGQINQLLTLIYVLLALAVLVSLFGIVNTLVLSIFERTRELGMLRAIGMSRRQLRRMIRAEGAITALIGGVLGLVVGLVFAVALTRSLGGDGFVLSIPVVTLLVVLLVAGLAGNAAAVLPARRAAKLDVVEALATE